MAEEKEEEEEGNRLKDCESHRDWKEERDGVDHSWGKRQSRQMFCAFDFVLLYLHFGYFLKIGAYF